MSAVGQTTAMRCTGHANQLVRFVSIVFESFLSLLLCRAADPWLPAWAQSVVSTLGTLHCCPVVLHASPAWQIDFLLVVIVRR